MRVPDNYFADFAERMVEKLPEREFAPVETPSLWVRVKPWIYMAAMFAGIWLMLKMFTGIVPVEQGQTPGVEMMAESVEEESGDDDLVAFYVDDYAAYDMLYADVEY